jgi:hypothetical protein
VDPKPGLHGFFLQRRASGVAVVKKALLLRAGCLAVAAAPLLACCLWVRGPHPQCCPDRDLIRVGMTMAEVRSILGEPKSTDTRPDQENWYYECPGWMPPPPISVHFAKDGRVVHVYILD